MEKKNKKIIGVICSSIFLFNFIGCNKNEKNALEYLNNKYGEEFELDGTISTLSGGDEFHLSKVKGTNAWPKNNPEEIFMLNLCENGEFVDDYQMITMKPYVDEYLTNMAREYWSDAAVSAKIVYGSLNEKYDVNYCEKYLADSKILTYYNIYLTYSNNFDIDIESKKIYDICSRLRELEIDNRILVTYLNKEFINEEVQEEGYWKACKSEGTIVRFFDESFNKDIPEKNKEIKLEDVKIKLEENRLETKE